MKVKKIITSILLSFSLLAGGITQAKPVAAALDKQQAIDIIKQNNQTNGQLDFTVSIKPHLKKGKKINVTAFSLTGGFNQNVAHMSGYAPTAKAGKSKKIEVWADGKENRLYTYLGDQWEYQPLNSSQNDQLTSSIAKTINVDRLLKKGKFSQKNGPYTLKTALNGKQAYKTGLKIARTASGVKFSKKELRYLNKHTKLGTIYATYRLQDDHLIDSKSSAKYVIIKVATVKTTFKVSHLGEYANLAVPDDVKKAAKPADVDANK